MASSHSFEQTLSAALRYTKDAVAGVEVSTEELLIILICLYGLAFLRRIVLFPLFGLLPLLVIGYYLFSHVEEPGGKLEKVFEHQYFVPCVALFILYTISRIREVSLSAAIAIVALSYLALGHKIPSTTLITSPRYNTALLIGIAVLLVFLLLRLFNTFGRSGSQTR